MRTLWPLILGILSLSASAQTTSFRNDREGTSFYAGNSYKKSIADVRADFSDNEILKAYRDALSANSNLCVYTINSQIRSTLLGLNRRWDNFEGIVYALRDKNEIDDIAAGILLRANKVVTTNVYNKDTSKLSSAGSSTFLQSNLKLVADFDTRLKTQCFDQAFQGLAADLTKADTKLDAGILYDRLLAGLKKRTITNALYSQTSADLQTYLTGKKIDASTYSTFLDQEAKKKVLTADQTASLKKDYQAFLDDSKKSEGKFDTDNMEALLFSAREKNMISEAQYVALEQARLNELQKGGLTLKEYASKLRVLRAQFPLRDATERSNFIATKADKTKMSYRQRLFENYSEIQIALMADMIRQLRRRLDSPNIEILVHNKDQTTETIALEPMDRFRFSLKKLRSEMKMLTLNSQFENRAPDYMDLIAASYEVSFIAGSELEQLAGLEDIWNPKKTFWEKAKVWLQTFSSVASVAIPAPYGFIPTLVLVVIEATVIKKDADPEDNGSLF